jgi:hypothetical protein
MEAVINNGTRVRIKRAPSIDGRPHLMQHIRQRDTGVIAGPSKQSPQMSALYVIVHFESCGHDHRMLLTELEEA